MSFHNYLTGRSQMKTTPGQPGDEGKSPALRLPRNAGIVAETEITAEELGLTGEAGIESGDGGGIGYEGDGAIQVKAATSVEEVRVLTPEGESGTTEPPKVEMVLVDGRIDRLQITCGCGEYHEFRLRY